MRSFSYQMVYIVCRDWETRDNVPIKKMLDKWYAFASTDIPPYTSAADLFYMTDVVNDLFLALYNSGKTCWTKRLIRAYNNIEEPEEPEEAERSEVAEESGSLNCQNNQI